MRVHTSIFAHQHVHTNKPNTHKHVPEMNTRSHTLMRMHTACELIHTARHTHTHAATGRHAEAHTQT